MIFKKKSIEFFCKPPSSRGRFLYIHPVVVGRRCRCHQSWVWYWPGRGVCALLLQLRHTPMLERAMSLKQTSLDQLVQCKQCKLDQIFEKSLTFVSLQLICPFEQEVQFVLKYWEDVCGIASYLKFSVQLSIRGNVFRKLSGSRQGKSKIHTFECIFSKSP